ncbi:TIR domain-containing protein [Deinococcus gobiensis]|uniref:TIR domain-containing protein n=1 Tax=Deinococcus gobiensis (strain DSM 21396 / JCM 16679 / CGMCC 1.7299 / I-0) TaxID=745776 RepID=H8GXQ6_DEIGI|nr:TIR domain-containing protein [Deinococcus gobiensis]AFD25908.1 hypothetical protein DGo_CA1981 [Deinococcus gobiensis I-0]
MKVFLSWSKEPSKSIATFLRGWLTDVIQSLEPWMSGEDIPVGDRWANQISGELESRNYGILILTPENQFQPWINYEAGALSKMVGSSRVIPYTFGFKPADVSSSPLTAFQGVEANEDGTWRMLVEINKGLPVPLAEPQLRRAFEKNWGDLDAELKRVAEVEAKREKANPGTTPPPRSDSDKLDEMLPLLRQIAQQTKESPEDRYRRARGQRNIDTTAEKIALAFKSRPTISLDVPKAYTNGDDIEIRINSILAEISKNELPIFLNRVINNNGISEMHFTIMASDAKSYDKYRAWLGSICEAHNNSRMRLVITNEQ